MLRRGLLVVGFLLTLGLPAEAVVITDGVLSAGVTSDFRPAFNMRGAGYELVRFDYSGEMLHFGLYTRPLGSLVDLSGTSIVKNWATAPSDFTGSLTFSIAPVVWRTGSTTPFTLTGVLNDTPIEGAGTLWIGLYRDDAPSLQQTTFTFAAPETGLAPVPEPGTMLLVGAGLMAVGLWVRGHRNNIPRAHSDNPL
jgi:PEP-CTERM motif